MIEPSPRELLAYRFCSSISPGGSGSEAQECRRKSGPDKDLSFGLLPRKVLVLTDLALRP